MKKVKKVKYEVVLKVSDLQNLPSLSGLFFAKIKVKGGETIGTTLCQEIENFAVVWNETFSFKTTLSYNSSEKKIFPCICKITVYKGKRRGDYFDKFSFLEFNLTDFADKGPVQHNCILESAKSSKNRATNSILRLFVTMTYFGADPISKPNIWDLQPNERKEYFPLETEDRTSRSYGAENLISSQVFQTFNDERWRRDRSDLTRSHITQSRVDSEQVVQSILNQAFADSSFSDELRSINKG
ncbi:early estrogen-induced gene 1 protein-like [Zophobas morio]|uniref:early estrogen-induced gene 1 protein-like n=1 Tax=Zophobas morio TaxID=2755281 RepID=UPI00308300FB